LRNFNKIPHSPFFTFIKGVESKSDIEILELFNFNEIELVKNSKEGNDENCIYLFRDGEWVHIMDNFYYTHWHSTQFQSCINDLGKNYEVFSCRLKDVDESYDFSYYRNGKLVRQYITESPNYSDIEIKVNLGEQLQSELQLKGKSKNVDIPIIVANSLGIKLAQNRDGILCYEVTLNKQKSISRNKLSILNLFKWKKDER